MLGIRYLKVSPTTHVILFKRGRIHREGQGLSFFYFAPTSVIATVPVGSVDVPFAFEEVSADFQEVTIQGELTFRVADARRLAALLDYSLGPMGLHRSDDPSKLNDRLIREAQIHARAFTQKRALADLLVSSDELVTAILGALKTSKVLEMLGVELLSFAVASIRPTPEMARALQADAREAALRRADEAVYARRNTAVELERKIKENELKTEIAIEQKRREVRETKMQADIAVETQRAALVDQRVENERKESTARAEALRANLQPLKDVDWRTLLAASSGGLSSRQLIAIAFRDLADNAGKIGRLNISPELLDSLLAPDEPSEPPSLDETESAGEKPKKKK